MHVSQLNSELSEMSSQLMIKEKELAKLKEDNKLLVKQIRGTKNRRRETISQVHCSYVYSSSYILFFSHNITFTVSTDPAGVVRQW